ncbi:ESPR-type extended signal peptide-containing protein [Actinobacillus equuli subsp. equuli]|uniref:ESPR-type extended signal peptide-containing protein n=1 Tax=Actinobacillus equuli subsp. equuli TaxID=202947 RepID=A0A9X4JCN9_ACTEU|nr:ESPR-type extended signal peptide-containing protein [Actinobacillus equuli]MDE8034048.1 ESPR-type extended signal peptide-containing protein [Actinobacillus equuli subsp. equuli]
MNKIFKVIWNHATQSFVVVSELTKAKGKSASVTDERGSPTASILNLGTVAFGAVVLGGVLTSPDANAAYPAGRGIASGQSSIAIGSNSYFSDMAPESSGDSSIAVGVSSIAQGINSTAIGKSANAVACGSMALGLNAIASGSDSVALGSYANATLSQAVAIGGGTLAACQSTAVGNNVKAFGSSSVAIGGDDLDETSKLNLDGSLSNSINGGQINTEFKKISGRDLVDLSQSYVNDRGEIRYSTQYVATNSSGSASVAIGVQAVSSGHLSTAIGTGARTAGLAATALGVTAKASGDGSFAGGPNAEALGVQSIAFGADSTADGEDATAVGGKARATGDYANALGTTANASANFSTAVGYNSVATGKSSNALGTESLAVQAYSNAIGYDAQARGLSSTAVGKDAIAYGAGDLAIGKGAHASSTNLMNAAENNLPKVADVQNEVFGPATSIGTFANATGRNTIAFGNNAFVFNTNKELLGAIAIGGNTVVSENYAISLGYKSSVDKADAIAIGRNASATIEDSIALGSGATTSAAVPTNSANVNGLTYSGFEGSQPTSVVSVGSATQKRQIQNVAAGQISATSTDAINGSQLHATQQVLSNTANTVKTILGGNSQLVNTGRITMSDIGNTGKTTVHDAIAAVKEKVAAGKNTQVTQVSAPNGSTTYTVDAWNTTVTNGSKEVSVTSKTDNTGKILAYTVDLSTSAKNNITTANVTAHNANATANTANATANTANTTANTANATANTANTTANTANTTANTANTTANTANATANTANTTANTANATANTANTTANTALEEVKKGWNITTKANGGSVTTSSTEQVSMGELVTFEAGSNINLTQTGANITIATSDKPTFNTVTTQNFNVQNGGTVDMGGNVVSNVGTAQKGTDAVNYDLLNKTVKAASSSVVAGTNTNVQSKASADGTVYTVNAYNTTVSNATDAVTVTPTFNAQTNTTNYAIDLSAQTKQNITTANTTAHSANATANAANTTANNALTEVKKGWNITTKANGGSVTSSSTEQVSMGGLVTFEAGSNINLTQKGANITIATSDKPTFDTVTTKHFNVQNGGTVDMGGNIVSNVGTAQKGTDAVNYDLLNKTVKAASSSVVAGTNANVQSKASADGTVYTVNAYNTTVSNATDTVTVTPTFNAQTNTTNYAIDLSAQTKQNITTANTTAHNANATANAANTTVNKGWNITTAKSGTGNVANNTDANVQMGDKVIITAGDNVNISQNGKNITIATSNKPTFSNVTTKDLNVQAGGTVNMGGNAITNVANGTKPTDAVNLQQLNASKVSVLAGLNTAVTATVNTTTGGTDYKVDAWNTTAQGATDISVTETVDVNTKAIKYSIDLSQSAKSNITTANTTAHNANATANTANATVNKGWNLTANKADANKANIQMGETVDFSQGDNIVVTQDGKGIKIATSKNPTFTEVTVGGDTKLTNDGLTINNGPSITNKGIDAASKPITNVAKGTNGTDAVNLDQLNEVKAATTTTVTSKDNSISVTESLTNGRVYDLSIAKSDIVTNPNGTTANKNAGNTFVTGDNLVNVLNNTSFNVTSGSVDSGKVTGTKAEQVKAGETVTFKAGNNLVLAQDGQNFTYSLSNTLDLTDKGSIKLGNTTLADNNVSVGNVSVTDKGINAANTAISNVKDGKVEAGSKEAVNGGQLFNATTNLTNAGLNFVGNNVSGVIHKNLSDTLAIVGALATDAAASAKNVRVDTENGKLVIKLSENPTFTTVTTGNTILDDKGLTIKNGPSITNNGIDAGNKQITNVAKAVNGTDAVNLDQLNTTVKAASSSVIAGSNANV